jgi:hypothetical protein
VRQLVPGFSDASFQVEPDHASGRGAGMRRITDNLTIT